MCLTLALALLQVGPASQASTQEATPAAVVAPDPFQQLCLRADLAEREGRLEDALRHADEAARLEPRKLEGHVLRAYLLAQAKRFSEAREALVACESVATEEQKPGLRALRGTIEALAVQDQAVRQGTSAFPAEDAQEWSRLQGLLSEANAAELIEARARKLWSFLKESERLVSRQPTFAPVHVVRCMAAVEVDSPSIGWTSYLRLKQLGVVAEPANDELLARLQAEVLRLGWDVPTRPSRPWSRWTKEAVLEAVELGDPEATEAVGVWYDLGQCDLPKSASEATRHLAAAAEAGLPTAQLRMGLRSTDANTAKGWYQRAALQGDPAAQAALGNLLDGDPKLEDDAKRKAVGWWRMALAGGVEGARGRLTRAYFLGDGVERDAAKAVEYWRIGEKNGDLASLRMLGICALTGEGMLYDAPAGAYYLAKAAEGGDAEAQYMLGLCHLAGHGVDVDKDAARRWIEQATLQGSMRAKEQLERLSTVSWGFAQAK